MDRVPGYEPGCSRFDSCQARQILHSAKFDPYEVQDLKHYVQIRPILHVRSVEGGAEGL